MPQSGTTFEKHLDARITLFIFDPIIKKHIALALGHLGFGQVDDQSVSRNYFEALSRLVPIISSDRELILINLPPKPRPSTAKNDVTAIYDQLNDMYLDIKTHLAKRHPDPLKFLSKTVPVVEVGDYLREKLIEVLFKYRVPAAFFMSTLVETRLLQGTRKAQQARENFQTHFSELSLYLEQYFRDRNELVALADEKLSEKELSERKKKFDQLMGEAKTRKEAGDFDGAINLLRQAIETYPKDIEPFLESGRLYTRKKEYTRALSRFVQAEELFQDAPAPNKEIANMRLTQVKERVEAGADPKSPEIMGLLEEAVGNYRQAHAKASQSESKRPHSPEFHGPNTDMAIGQEILKWDLGELLGPKHPVVSELLGLARSTTAGLEQLPIHELSSMQCISLGLQALEAGDIPQAQKYYFHALIDKERFSQICTEINMFGIKLRTMGRVDDAVKVYTRLLKYNPPNQGPVYWNLAIAQAHKNEVLSAAGFVARCLYTDPFLAKEKEFYESLTSALVPVTLRLLRALRMIAIQSKKVEPDPRLAKLYQAQERLVALVAAGKMEDALKLFLGLARQAPKFTVKPEFHADGVVFEFLKKIRVILAKNPRNQANLKAVDAWLKYVLEHPAPKAMVQYRRLCDLALETLRESGDQNEASFFLGQALILLPEEYWSRPDFHSLETLPSLAWELTKKTKFVDLSRFPKVKPGSAAPGPATPKPGRPKAEPATKK
ncbi:MAG: tetratricopeptide repeat protein [Pseudomonadota bacterium]